MLEGGEWFQLLVDGMGKMRKWATNSKTKKYRDGGKRDKNLDCGR